MAGSILPRLLFCWCLTASVSAQQLVVRDEQGYSSKPVVLTCRVEAFEAVLLQISKLAGNLSDHSITTISTTEVTLTILAAELSDEGIFSCTASSANNMQSLTSDFTLTMSTYQRLQREGPVGQRMISTADGERIRCPVSGVPSYSEVFWQIGLAQSSPNVTTERGGDGPFVGEDGYLDLTTSTSEDENSFRCTAVNIFGDRVEQTFYITIVRQPPVALWRQWYIILVYCVVGVVLLVVLLLLLWCFCVCCCTRDVKKEHNSSKSAQTQLFTRSALPEAEDSRIDSYAYDGDEG